MLFWKAAENKLLRELVDSKQAVVEKTEALVKKMEEQQDSTARELLHTVARHRAVIVHRVLLDSCLRGGCYDAKQTFTQRYQQFITGEVLGEDGRFTIVADRIMQEIPGRYQVKATNIKKELDGLPHQSSKPFHFLQDGTDAGLYIGRRPPKKIQDLQFSRSILHYVSITCALI